MTDAPFLTNFDEQRYRPLLIAQGRSATLRSIWKRAYGSDLPDDVEPLGFSTTTILQRAAGLLAVRPGETFVDLGCGRGGPGLWVSRETGASVVGIDIVEEALDEAVARAATFGVSGRARFAVGSVTNIPCETESFDGALSIDSLWMVLDKPAAIAEVARILKPGRMCACTTWEPDYLSYAELFSDGGFDLVAHEETDDWRERQLVVYHELLRNQGPLTQELGSEAAGVLLAEARDVPAVLSRYRRLLIAARAPHGDYSAK